MEKAVWAWVNQLQKIQTGQAKQTPQTSSLTTKVQQQRSDIHVLPSNLIIHYWCIEEQGQSLTIVDHARPYIVDCSARRENARSRRAPCIHRDSVLSTIVFIFPLWRIQYNIGGLSQCLSCPFLVNVATDSILSSPKTTFWNVENDKLHPQMCGGRQRKDKESRWWKT